MQTSVRRACGAALISCTAALPAFAALPAVNLQIEVRWVESPLPAAALAGVRDGATVTGTAGSVSPHGALITSSAPPQAAAVQRLTVLNGQSSQLQLSTREPLQWVEASVDLDPAAAPASAVRRIRAVPHSGERITEQSIRLTPQWPGGRAPVRVALDMKQQGTELQSTVLVPMERWQTVARTGSSPPPSERGLISSGDAEGRVERELQLRIAVQP